MSCSSLAEKPYPTVTDYVSFRSDRVWMAIYSTFMPGFGRVN